MKKLEDIQNETLFYLRDGNGFRKGVTKMMEYHPEWDNVLGIDQDYYVPCYSIANKVIKTSEYKVELHGVLWIGNRQEVFKTSINNRIKITPINMNAFKLRQLLNDIEANGQDLNDLPILFIEENRNRKDKYAGLQSTEKDINIVNVKKFNDESSTLELQTQFDKAILIGPIIECD